MGTRKPGPQQRRLPTRADARLTTVAFPRALHERLMVHAVRSRLTAAEIIRRAVVEWLDHHA